MRASKGFQQFVQKAVWCDGHPKKGWQECLRSTGSTALGSKCIDQGVWLSGHRIGIPCECPCFCHIILDHFSELFQLLFADACSRSPLTRAIDASTALPADIVIFCNGWIVGICHPSYEILESSIMEVRIALFIHVDPAIAAAVVAPRRQPFPAMSLVTQPASDFAA